MTPLARVANGAALAPPDEAPPVPALSVPAPPVALYVHIPFCVSHCPYCDFVVVAGREARGPANRIGVFATALQVELGLRADALDARWGPPGARPLLDTLYFGGGTPSLLPVETLHRLIRLIGERFGLAADAEISLEVNPGPDERGNAPALRAAGVTRLSIGAQSMDATEIRSLGRRHSPEDVTATVRAARDAGFESVSLDLLYDIPGSSLADWQRTLDAMLDLEPDHVSMYGLTLDDPDAEGITGPGGDHLPLSDGARRWRAKARLGQDEDRAAAMYELADGYLADAGFTWYEISNWARPGHRSRHNLTYWQGRAWEAVGPGAHAFDGQTRRWNAAHLDSYLAALLPGDGAMPRPPPGDRDDLPTGRESEAAILALRTSAGLPVAALDSPALGPALTWARDARLIELAGDDRLVLTMAGRMLSNEVFIRLL